MARTIFWLPLALVVLPLLAGCCCKSRCCDTVIMVQEVPEGPLVDAATGMEMPEAEPTHPDRALEANLSRKKIKGLDWKAISLPDAVMYLRTISGANFLITPQARKDGAEDVEITLQADGVSIAEVLGLITTPHGLRWGVKDGVVIIRSETEPNGQAVVQIHAIADLVGEAHHQWGSGEMAAHEVMLRVQPEYWLDEQYVIRSQGSSLVVRASPAVQDAVALFFDRERAERSKRRVPPALRKRLKGKRVSVSIESGTMRDVMRKLLFLADTPMALDADAPAARALAGTRVARMELEDVALVDVMELLGQAAGPHSLWIQRNGILYLTRVERED